MLLKAFIAMAAAAVCGGCAYTPGYDLPVSNNGAPTVASIVARIECELTQMVAFEGGTLADPKAYVGPDLVLQDYDVEVFLSIEVNDTGGLAPTLTAMTPYAVAGTSFALGATGNLSESRDQTFTESLRFNMTKLHKRWLKDKSLEACIPQDTPLSGQLDLANFASMAENNQTGYGYGGLNTLDMKQALSGKGAFGGEVKFTITSGFSAAGPTWTLTHFKGPGGLASFSRVNTDSLTIAFAPHAASGGDADASKNQTAHELIIQIISNSIANNINILNVLH